MYVLMVSHYFSDGDVSYSNNPGFDYETKEQYQIWITASAGGVASNPHNLTVQINNIAEPPVVSSSISESSAMASEDLPDGSFIYQVKEMLKDGYNTVEGHYLHVFFNSRV